MTDSESVPVADLIERGRDMGLTHREMSELTGISLARVSQIVRENDAN